MFVIVEQLYGIQGGGRGKENDRELTILKCIISVQVDNIIICIESY
jgi:hypothetical protein